MTQIPAHTFILILVNALSCAILQLAIAAIAVRVDARHFALNSRLYRTHPCEIAFYRNILHIRRWKSLLPDGATWVGSSFRKKRLAGCNTEYFRQFLIEACRGEATHWAALACFPLFFLFNPPSARAVITVYFLAANLPCILVQRYNRHVSQKIIGRRSPT